MGSSTPGPPPSVTDPQMEEKRQELLGLHELHVSEYRFQVELNWKRSQYLLALNVAVLVAGGGLFGRSTSSSELLVVAAVFAAGVGATWLAYRIISWQHEYYRNARDRLGEIESALGLGKFAIKTTPGMGGENVPRGKVTPTLLKTVLLLGLLDFVGLAVALYLLWSGVPASTA